MTNRTQSKFLALVFAMGLTGCDGASSVSPILSSPTSPLSPPVSATPTLIVFTEPGTGFSTSEVRDVQDRVLQLNTANELIFGPPTARGFRGTASTAAAAIRGCPSSSARYAPKAVPSKFVSEPGTASGVPI